MAFKISLSQLTGRFITFAGKKTEAGSVTSFYFKPHKGVHWQAGQYYVYFMPGALLDKRSPLRPFTVSNPPSAGNLQISTRLSTPSSPFKTALQKLQPGNKVWAFGPFGFFMHKPTPHDVFIAGGIGVTPYRAMLLEYAASGVMPPITLVYSNRDQNIVFKTELDELATRFPSLTIHYVVEPERITMDYLKNLFPDFAACTFYLSGPKPMVEAFDRDLRSAGAVHVRRDAFKGYPLIA